MYQGYQFTVEYAWGSDQSIRRSSSNRCCLGSHSRRPQTMRHWNTLAIEINYRSLVSLQRLWSTNMHQWSHNILGPCRNEASTIGDTNLRFVFWKVESGVATPFLSETYGRCPRWSYATCLRIHVSQPWKLLALSMSNGILGTKHLVLACPGMINPDHAEMNESLLFAAHAVTPLPLQTLKIRSILFLYAHRSTMTVESTQFRTRLESAKPIPSSNKICSWKVKYAILFATS